MNVCIVDIETAFSADDCLYCDVPLPPPVGRLTPCRAEGGHHPRGWRDFVRLGLSIGGYCDYMDQKIHWFDYETLEDTMKFWVERQPLLVSFNGIAFDFPLLQGVLRGRFASAYGLISPSCDRLCRDFALLFAHSYDILQEVWAVNSEGRHVKGLNSLGGLSVANGLGEKLTTGAQAPRLWRTGRHAEVINYCADDIYKTKALFEMVLNGQHLARNDGSRLLLRKPDGAECHAWDGKNVAKG